MSKRILWGLGALGVTSSIAFGADWLRRTQSQPICRLPCYHYRTSHPSNPRSAVSTVGLEAAVAGRIDRGASATDAAQTVRTKTFQLSTATLQNDHCELERVTMTIVEDGSYILNFEAEQNPSLVPEIERPQYERYLHNHFFVQARGTGLAPVGVDPEESVLGQPEFFKVCLPPMLIEKRARRNLRWTGCCDEIRRSFDVIDRVEIDLSYE
jgi:hypothetical protein